MRPFPLNEKRLLLVLLATFVALAAYLHTPAALDGDGAAYTLQSLAGRPFDRSLHVGVLVPLWAWVAIGGGANLFAIVWGLALLLGLHRLGRSVAPDRSALLAPAVFLGAAAAWQAALFVEVYGPLAALAVWSVVALRADRPTAAGVLLGWAVLMHPGALALLPGLLLLGGRRPAPRTLALALLLPAGVWAALWPDPWTGGRGLASLPAADTGWFRSLQRAWRLLARDLGLTAGVLVLGSIAAWATDRRLLIGLAAVVAGAALGLDRYSDNAGHLVSFALCCGLAPLAPRVIRSAPRPTAIVLAGLCVLGVAEATSKHDALRRAVDRDAARQAESCHLPGPTWAEAMRRELACRDRSLAEAPTGR